MKKLKPELSIYFFLAIAWLCAKYTLQFTGADLSSTFQLCFDLAFLVISFLTLCFFNVTNDKAELKLKESEAEVRGIFDVAQELFCVIDHDFKIIDYNKRFEDAYLIFYRKTLALGNNYLEIYPEKDRSLIAEHILEAFKGQAYEFERSISNEFGVEIWVKICYKPLLNSKGETRRLIISLTDITTYKLALKALDETNSKFESIFNYATDALFIIDNNKEFIIDCNTTALKLFEAERKNQILGLKGPELHLEMPSISAINDLNESFKGDSMELYEFEYKTFKGNVFWGSFLGKTIETSYGLINLVRIVDISTRKDAELKINQIERRFRQLADSSPAMLWISNENGKIIFYNTSWLEFRGISLNDETDWGWKDGIYPDDYNKLIYEVYNPAINHKKGFTTEYRLKNKQGEYRWILENAVPKFALDGNFEGLFGSAIDITELKEVQRKIEESEAKFRELADTSPIMLWTADTIGNITFYNSAWLNFTGRTFEQEIGNGWIDNVHPEDIIPYVNNTYYASFQSQKSYSMEFRLKRFDNDYRWVFESGTPKFNSDGVFEGLVGSAIDITDRKTAELNLKQQEKFNSRISELSPDQIYIFDLVLKQSIYSNRNLTELLGYTKEDYSVYTETTFLELINPEDYANVKYTDEYFSRLKEKKFLDNEFRMKAPNGSWRWIHTRETIFSYDESGQPSQILGNARDITDKKLAEQEIIQTNEELKTINEELDGFVYRASHDLRAPLSSVLGLINLAKIDVKEETALFYLDMMQKSILKLSNVTQDLIDHAQNASVVVTLVPIDFETLIKDIIDGMRFHENAARIKFDIIIEEKHEFISDKLRLTLLFNNLISNAIKYHDMAKENPFLKITIKLNAKNALIEVADNGLGIEEEYQDRIFDMFFRANKTIAGTGLGLFIVKGAIDKLKGTIKLISKAKVGTSFHVEIPNRI